MTNLFATAWWLYAILDDGYRENYWAAVAANQAWYTIIDHLTQHPGDP